MEDYFSAHLEGYTPLFGRKTSLKLDQIASWQYSVKLDQVASWQYSVLGLMILLKNIDLPVVLQRLFAAHHQLLME